MNITPTDIDCSVDFRGRTFIFVEGKTNGTEISEGQRLHLENLVRGLRDGGRKAFAVIVEHPDGDGEVDYASCRISQWFYGDVWLHTNGTGRTLRKFFEWAKQI